MPKKTTRSQRKADQYNDPKHNYLHYWDHRQYEHEAEELAIARLLRDQHFKKAIDIGGGYGRLSAFLENYADKVILAEPSEQQLDIAAEFLKDHPRVDRKLWQAADLKLKDGEVDLAVMVRVMHHLPDPSPELHEIARVLSADGTFILEFANYAHAENRFKHVLKGRRLPLEPVDIRSEENKRKDEIPFVNHNPKTVVKHLAHAGLRVEKVLSVSNLRSPGLKKVLPKGLMLSLEKLLQPTLAKTYFGPSIFLLVKKAR